MNLSLQPKTLSQYYLTNYTYCPPNKNLIESPDFLLKAAISESFILIPVNLFGIYCIVWHTPKYMESFQFHLFHLHFWLLLLTICYTLLTTPYYFFPVQVRYSLGLFRFISMKNQHQHYIVSCIYGGILVSVLMMFENRHRQLVPPNDLFYKLRNSHRVFLVILNFCCGSAGSLPIFMEDLSNQEQMKLKYLEEIPCPTEIYFDPHAFALGNSTNIYTAIALIFNLIGAVQLFFFIIHSTMYLRKIQLIQTFSIRTKRIQKSFFKSALAQVASPISVLLVPLMLLTYVRITRQYLQGLTNICILSIPAHSIFSTASLLIFNAPYRKFTKDLFRLSEYPSNRVVVPSLQQQ
ncbi:hypothetical protein CRE_29643 [Caenorhabditis remanei]|uniref:Serpentine Receptor, class H n=1 Tax=Caenorhabditis remanei TaxID=31234 RepID=E3LUY5_CAERE|nr:hypothetical protein CRE_29643 [Caenorhabditis remanei]